MSKGKSFVPARACDTQTVHLQIEIEGEEDGKKKRKQVGTLHLNKRFDELLASGAVKFRFEVGEGLRSEKQINEILLVRNSHGLVSIEKIKEALFPFRDYANGERLFEGMNAADLADFLIHLNEAVDGTVHWLEVVLDKKGKKFREAFEVIRDFVEGFYSDHPVPDKIENALRVIQREDGHATPVYVKPGVTVKEVELGAAYDMLERHFEKKDETKPCPTCDGHGVETGFPDDGAPNPPDCPTCHGSGEAPVRLPFRMRRHGQGP